MTTSGDAATAEQLCPHLASETRDFTDHYEEIIAKSLREGPVAWDETYGRCFVMGYDQLTETARNWQTFSSASGVVQEFSPRLLPLEADPPFHRELRVMLNPFVTAGAISTVESEVQRIADELIDKFIGAGRAEVVTQYSRPFPGMVFFALIMNLPEDDLERLQHLAEEAVTPGNPEKQMAGFAGVSQYVAELVDRRTGEPDARDLVGTIVNVNLGDRKITREEAISICTMLIFGGLETTTSTLGLSLSHLAQHQEDQEHLRAHPDRLADAVEELLRLYGPTIQLNRLTLHDSSIAGVPVPEGVRVALSFASANRDPEEFVSPNEYRLDRESNRHVAFGVGVHRCLGSHLARAMLRVGVGSMIERLGPFELAKGFTPRHALSGVRALESLDIVFESKRS